MCVVDKYDFMNFHVCHIVYIPSSNRNDEKVLIHRRFVFCVKR